MKIILVLIVGGLLAGCSSSSKPLGAPCTYNSRSPCGQIIPLQQNPV